MAKGQMNKGTNQRRKEFAKFSVIRVKASAPLLSPLPPVKHSRIRGKLHNVTSSAAISFQPLPILATGGIPPSSRRSLGEGGSTLVTIPVVPCRARSWGGGCNAGSSKEEMRDEN